MLTTKEGMIKVADFGVATLTKSRLSGDMSSDNVLGSPYWMAPEIIQMESSHTSSDIWSLGCTIIELMTGEPPYYHMPQLSAMYHIAETTEPPPFPENISEELRDFLTKCFERDPMKRPSAVELLNHKWLSKARQRRGTVSSYDNQPNPLDTIVSPRRRKRISGKSGSIKRSVLRTESSKVLGIGNELEKMTQIEEELEALRQEVVIEVRNNLLLEADVKRLDKKIELLIRNRVSIQEVIRSQKASRISYSKRDSLSDEIDSDNIVQRWKNSSLKDGYSKLFYLLQANPKYLTGLMFFQPDESGSFIETLILTLFGFAFSPREEYLLLQLFESAIQKEINNITSIQSFSDEASVLLRMILAYSRRIQEQAFLRRLLSECIDKVIELNESLEYDYKRVYKTMINQQETETGKVDEQLDPNASDEDILNNPRLLECLHRKIDLILESSNIFLNKILSSLDQFPYGIRMITRWIKLALMKKFPNSEDSITALIGYLIYYRFLNPAIIAPEDYEMTDTLTTQQRVNLATVSKILSHITSGQCVQESNDEIKRLNEHIKEGSIKLKNFLTQLTENLEEPAEYLNIDKTFLEYTLKHSPVIYISPNEMFLTHKYLLTIIDKIAPNDDDPLRLLLKELPDPLPVITDDPRLETEISLTLEPSLSFDDKKETRSMKINKIQKLYTTTKKMICRIIRDSYRDTLSELDLFELLTGPEASGNSKLTQTVGRILENLEKLEKKGICSKKDHYKSVLEDIQNDIWRKQSVKNNLTKERDQLKITLERLKEKKSYLQEQLTAYNNYVKVCLEQSVSLKKKNNKGSAKKKQKKSIKYTCANLIKKGVIEEVSVPSSQHSTISFELVETETIGIFNVKVMIAGIVVQTITIVFDDLLEKQENGTYFLELMDGRVKLRINLLIHLLNKVMLM